MKTEFYCRTCEGYHRNWWKRNLLYHVAMSMKLAALIVRKPWHETTDEPFANIHWSLAWEVARDIHWKKGRAV